VAKLAVAEVKLNIFQHFLFKRENIGHITFLVSQYHVQADVFLCAGVDNLVAPEIIVGAKGERIGLAFVCQQRTKGSVACILACTISESGKASNSTGRNQCDHKHLSAQELKQYGLVSFQLRHKCNDKYWDLTNRLSRTLVVI
jgi:hypothetical protein